MQREPSFFNGQVSPTDAYGVGGSTCNTEFGGHYAYGAPAAPAFGAALADNNHDFLPGPLNGLEFQAMDTCPQNYIIFDQTENKSRVMFHPALARELNCPYDFNNRANNVNDGGSTPEKNDENQDDDISPLKENTADIDALLSSEEEDDEEDDMVSTGRSPANWAGSSPDCSSSDEEWKSATSHKSYSSCAGGASSSSSDNRRKRERMRKMIKVLRGIIPGGESMGTPAVLDEAVKYLKSLKIEVKKLGIQNFDNY